MILRPRARKGGTKLKTPAQIQMMREAGKLVAQALRICRQLAKPGTKTIEIDQAVEAHYASHGAIPLFKGYPGSDASFPPFPGVTCISVNEQVVHGIPGNRQLKEGDIISIDTACKLDGWCADAAISFAIGKVRPERQRLIDTGEEVLRTAILELGRRNKWSEVASRMEKVAKDAKFDVVTSFVGHGIGEKMHEDPQVPNYYSRDFAKKDDFPLEVGLVLAVEPMVNMGRADIELLDDGWTVVTKDGMPSVHVEHTLAITENGVVVVTDDGMPELAGMPIPPGLIVPRNRSK
jgi:methionyl aminopeptidase